MSVTINGTTGIAGVDGSASTPAYQGADTNTGIAFPAADTVSVATGGTERMRVDSSGNVGIGTSSPSELLQINGSSPFINIRDGANNNPRGIEFDYGGTQITGSLINYGGTGETALSGGESGSSGYFLTFKTDGSERMRIDPSGNLLLGDTGSSITSGTGIKFVSTGSATPYMGIVVDSSNGGDSLYHLFNVNATNNGYRWFVKSNGGVSNYSGNNTNLSDERTKTNIDLAGNYLDKICAIPVKFFNYKDEPDNEQRTLGVIAQDVEAIAPEFVNNDGWAGTDPEDGPPLKSIYTTDMMFGMLKAIQELKAITDTQAQTIAALEAKVAALEAQP